MVELFKHQAQAIDAYRKSQRLALYWQPGCGKTIAVLAICKAFPMRTLVVAPLSTLRTAWGSDAQLFPSIRTKIIRSVSARLRRAMIEAPNWDLAVTNYDVFRAHAGDFERAGVRRFVIDESVKVKNRNAKLTRAAIAFSDRMESVIALSGLPAPNDGTEYWAQMRCVDRRCLGENFWRHVNQWFVPEKRWLRGKEVVVGFTQTPEQREAFQTRLKSWAWRLTKSECLDLPPQIDMIREVELPADEAAAYATAENRLRIIIDGEDHGRIDPAAQLMKLRQITGGAVRVEGEPVVTGRAKLAALEELIEDEIGAETPLVVWAEFRAEIDEIHKTLSQRGPCRFLDGRTSGDAVNIVGDFEAGKIRYIVAHPAAAGHGTNGLQRRCSHAVFYSLSFSLDQHTQARDRIHRAGMVGQPATYWYLVCPDTVDETALWTLRKKGKASDLILRALGRGELETVETAR